jgi:hypothetical protein
VLRLRNHIKKGLALGAALAAIGGVFAPAARATPAGLTFYPSTDIYGKGNWHFDADAFLTDDQEVGTLSSFGLSYGTGPDRDGVFGRSEIGFDYITSGAFTSFSKRFLLNAKTQLFNSDSSQTRVVAGAWGVGGKEAFAPNVLYLLGSKNFDFGRVHVGVAHALSDERIALPGGDEDTFLHLGYDKVFANNKLQFTVDYYSGDTAISALAPGLIYYINDKAAVQLGYIRYNNSSLGALQDQVYLAFDYNFGGGSTEAPAPAAETSTTAPATQ